MIKKLFLFFSITLIVLASCSTNDCEKDEVINFLVTSEDSGTDIILDIEVVKAYPDKRPDLIIDMLAIQSEYRYIENPPCTENYKNLTLDFMSSFIDYVSAGPDSPQESVLWDKSNEAFNTMLVERDRLNELIGNTEE